jgi:hypothetical protein
MAPGGGAKDIVITTEGERTTNNKLVLAGLAGGAAVLGGIGLYYNLDSRSAASSVSAENPTNKTWTPADASDYSRAHDSAVKAGVFYGIGGALLVGAVVGLIATAPKSETTVMHTAPATATPIVAPTPGGAVLGGSWRF